MDYKTILVHAEATPQGEARIALAAQLALRHDAHLVGVALTGVSRFYYREAGADLARTVLAPLMDTLYRRAEQALERFIGLAAAAGVPSFEQRLVDDEVGAGLALSGRYADLVVLGQTDPGTPAPATGGDLAAHVLLACPRPVLVVPYIQRDASAGRHVLLAWNGSVEATRALDGALPLLRRAASVTVASFCAPDAPAAGPELQAYLKRQGIGAECVVQAARLDSGEPLLSLAAERGADLLVMGGYGRLRLSELLLGGVTRSILGDMTVPVLMAH
ncbi:universal stress protein [Massilia sp. GCM10023247]|uniref:universal stress protein n=1 Tax=Massilia sp. GCM10023247 TaxID=3252643 RepID=UPI003620B9C0